MEREINAVKVMFPEEDEFVESRLGIKLDNGIDINIYRDDRQACILRIEKYQVQELIDHLTLMSLKFDI